MEKEQNEDHIHVEEYPQVKQELIVTSQGQLEEDNKCKEKVSKRKKKETSKEKPKDLQRTVKQDIRKLLLKKKEQAI